MKYLITIMFLLFSFQLFAQSTGKSKSGGLHPKKEIPVSTTKSEMDYYSPFLEVDVIYSEPSGNNFLDANEVGNISLSIKNVGKMSAEECRIQLVSEGRNPEIKINGLKIIPKIDPGEVIEMDITLTASESIKTVQEKFTLKIIEKNGFDLEPEKLLIISTREFQPPIIEVVDYGIEDQSRNLKIEKRELVDVTFRIQNKGESTSYGIYATVTPGNNVLSVDVKDKYEIGDLNSGEYKDIRAQILTNARATEVKITVSIYESTGKYSSTKTFNLPFDVEQKKPEEIIIAKGVETGLVIPTVSVLKLDIAENIPETDEKKPDAVAIIIGNKDYNYTYNVDFAINDAALVRNYVEKSLGYSTQNIIFMDDASQADLIRVFGSESNYKGTLYDYVKKGLSEVFIYYSGHGAPDPNTKQGYIVPVDCDPNKVSLNGYSLQTLYSNLDKLANEKQVVQLTVVIDACFSGESDKGSLLSNISPIYITVDKQSMSYESASVFTSASGDQVSNWYPEKKQGLFTYFFLKGLRGEADFDKNTIITTSELYQYVADEVNGVPYWSRRISGRTQTPTFIGTDYDLYK
ncbi:caspase family protein [Bacteroidota bacterium]